MRWAAITAIAPIAWGSTYVVTASVLPAGQPLWGATLRALPAGLVLMLLVRTLPRGRWWARAAVLGVLNVAAFFPLIYLAALLLPSSMASSIMAAAPVAMMAAAWALTGVHPTLRAAAGAAMGVIGVLAIVGAATTETPVLGVLAAVTAMAMNAVGAVLSQRWRGEHDVRTVTAWQVSLGGLILLAAALLVEGAPPALDGPAVAGFAYISLIATAVAYLAWFGGLQRLPAATVGVIGLLNPVTGVLLGVLVANETLTLRQGLGILAVLVGILIVNVRRPRRATRTDRPVDTHLAHAVATGQDTDIEDSIGSNSTQVVPGSSRTSSPSLSTSSNTSSAAPLVHLASMDRPPEATNASPSPSRWVTGMGLPAGSNPPSLVTRTRNTTTLEAESRTSSAE